MSLAETGYAPRYSPMSTNRVVHSGRSSSSPSFISPSGSSAACRTARATSRSTFSRRTLPHPLLGLIIPTAHTRVTLPCCLMMSLLLRLARYGDGVHVRSSHFCLTAHHDVLRPSLLSPDQPIETGYLITQTPFAQFAFIEEAGSPWAPIQCGLNPVPGLLPRWSETMGM
jgi:hypothetical protein